MVSSISATERIKLWDEFSKPIDHETVKTEFLRKVHSKNPPFRFKLKPKRRSCAEIPPMVEFHYKNRPPLLPSLRDVLRCERVYREHGFQHISKNQDLFNELAEDMKSLQDANHKIREFEEDIRKTNETVEFEKNKENSESVEQDLVENGETIANYEEEEEVISEVVEKEATSMTCDEKTIEKIEIHPKLNNDENSCNDLNENGISRADGEEQSSNVNQNDTEQEESVLTDEANKIASNRTNKRKRAAGTKGFGVECDDLLELSEEVFKSKLEKCVTNGTTSPQTIEEQLKGLDIDVIKRLAFAQLQQILEEKPDLVNKLQNETANTAIKDALQVKPVQMTLPSQLLSKDDIARIADQFIGGSSSSDEIVDIEQDASVAAVRQPITPMPQLAVESFYYANGFEQILDDGERALAVARRLERPLRESKIRARAVLTPVGDILSGKRWYTNTSIDDSIFMRYRTLTIGSGNGCDLQWKNTRNCARFSEHHATIFYDEVILSHLFLFS